MSESEGKEGMQNVCRAQKVLMLLWSMCVSCYHLVMMCVDLYLCAYVLNLVVTVRSIQRPCVEMMMMMTWSDQWQEWYRTMGMPFQM